MPYRSLLVFVAHETAQATRTQAALRLARDLDCHLVGLAPTGLFELPASPGSAVSLAEFTTQAWDVLRAEADEAARQFAAACHAAGLRSFETVVDEADKVASLLRRAHFSDLAVLTQADAGARGHERVQDLVEKMVLHSARPTLVLPAAWRAPGFGSHVLVAWDDSREAARALADALPLLHRAQRVQVVRWTDGHDHGNDDSPPGASLEAVRQWLLHHGVQAEVQVVPVGASRGHGIAAAILASAAALGADLIVMGAYGHARWAERLLGGATRGMLAAMTVPVLMSH